MRRPTDRDLGSGSLIRCSMLSVRCWTFIFLFGCFGSGDGQPRKTRNFGGGLDSEVIYMDKQDGQDCLCACLDSLVRGMNGAVRKY